MSRSIPAGPRGPDQRPLMLRPLLRPERGQGTLTQRQLGVGNHQVWVDAGDTAEALASRTRPERAVEREQLGSRVLERHPVALEAGGKVQRLERPLARCRDHDGPLVALAERLLDRVGDPVGRRVAGRLGCAVGTRGGRQPVHQHQQARDRRADRLGRRLGQVDHLGLSALLGLLVSREGDQAEKAPRAQGLQFLDLLRALVRGERKAEVEPRSPGQPGLDLLGRRPRAVPSHHLARHRRHRRPDARQQQAEVVVDLGLGRDRRPRVFGPRLLLDRDGRREAGDHVHVRLVHPVEELAGVGAQRLDVAPLALGVDRVEHQRGLPRPRRPRNDDQLLLGDCDVDVLEVVLTRALDHQVAPDEPVPGVVHGGRLGSLGSRFRLCHVGCAGGRRRAPPVDRGQRGATVEDALAV